MRVRRSLRVVAIVVLAIALVFLAAFSWSELDPNLYSL
jgi:hypothetical protein